MGLQCNPDGLRLDPQTRHKVVAMLCTCNPSTSGVRREVETGEWPQSTWTSWPDYGARSGRQDILTQNKVDSENWLQKVVL